jgi:predicted amidohydrolase YtcJ
VEAGVRVAGASDGPIESVDVLQAIHCCVTREGFEPQQCITAAQAIRAYTLDAAYAQFEEGVKGSISPGKRADLVILSANPASVPVERIKDIDVETTVVGGKTIYQG